MNTVERVTKDFEADAINSLKSATRLSASGDYRTGSEDSSPFQSLCILLLFAVCTFPFSDVAI